MASYAKDPRCIAMAEALVPLLRRSCPEGAGGVELIRAALHRVWGEPGEAPSSAARSF